MNIKEEEFLKRLLATFKLEAEEHLHAISTGLIELEKSTDSEKTAGLIETIFREAHSLKGAARSVNIRDIETICQALEDAFAALKRKEISLTQDSYDLLHKAVDNIKQLVSVPDSKQSSSTQLSIRELIQQLLNSTKGVRQPGQAKEPARKQPVKEVRAARDETIPASLLQDEVVTVRIPKTKLEPLFLQAEEMIQAKIATAQRAAELQALSDSLEWWKTESRKWKTRHSTNRERHYNEWMEWNEQQLDEIEQKMLSITRAAEGDQRIVGRMVDDHLEAMKTILMLPVASLVEVFPLLVRDLASDQNKQVELILHGTELEVDKRVLEELKDPLIHLLKNCVDHGIEKPHERTLINKPVRGIINLTFSVTESRRLEVVISDDGLGIDLDKVCAAAIKAELVSDDAASKLGAQEKLSLIFQSGVTTSSIITDISGRGLGMAIVQEKIEKLDGTITVESQPNIGTTFRLILPLTLSTFRGILVEAGDQFFVLPTINVERTVRVNKEEIKTVENRETIMIDGQIVLLVSLCKALGVPVLNNGSSPNTSGTLTAANVLRVVVLAYVDRRIAFQVDEIIGEQQILVKKLGRQLRRVRNIAGAAVLGSGKVVPVINVSDLMKSAIRTEMAAITASGEEKKSEKTYRMLVAEDSITSRNLIKNILESAGYEVVTSVDGADAFTKALTGEFDLIVSDVDMPRMNGFELTTKIRKNKRLGELPVVLVTALESRKDREYGIEVGANAYIIKSSFDQSNLLEVIQRLI
ncbi:MAG TPA: response regulator [Anaerolineae bacterium]|nr:response regulator [Anaerolineae bacterium]